MKVLCIVHSFSLTNDEIFIGTVIFRLLNVMPCNSHDISEFDSPVSDYFAPGAQKVSIGAGLYPCLGDFIFKLDFKKSCLIYI